MESSANILQISISIPVGRERLLLSLVLQVLKASLEQKPSGIVIEVSFARTAKKTRTSFCIDWPQDPHLVFFSEERKKKQEADRKEDSDSFPD